MPEKAKMRTILLSGILTSSIAAAAAFGQPNREKTKAEDEQMVQSFPAVPSPQPVVPMRNLFSLTSSQSHKHADNFYRNIWGIDKLEVRETASGVLLRFSYRVTDAIRAKGINDEKATPYLIDEMTGAVLQVPTMPKVGLLRQTADPANGRDYWMVFSNKRNFVKPGSRVDIVIGKFRANGLIVQQ